MTQAIRKLNGSGLTVKSFGITAEAGVMYSTRCSLWAAMVKATTTPQNHITELQPGTSVLRSQVCKCFSFAKCFKQCYWSLKDGNDTVVWADANLTPKGIAQAQIANRFWASEISIEKIPTPESYYTSPLTRCLVTANITFSGLKLPSRYPFIPEVKELFREGISGHTCDRRNSKTYIQENFPTYKIEAGFSETDLLWKPLQAETPPDQDIRTKKVLDDVFSNDDSTYISITSHSGEIASLLRGSCGFCNAA